MPAQPITTAPIELTITVSEDSQCSEGDYDSLVNAISVQGHEVTKQDVPIRRIFGNWMFSRLKGSNQNCLLGEHENELLAMMVDMECTYTRRI